MYDFLFIRAHAATTVDDERLMIKKIMLNDSAHIWTTTAAIEAKKLNTIQISNCIHTIHEHVVSLKNCFSLSNVFLSIVK